MFILLSLILSGFYGILIIYYLAGWLRLPYWTSTKHANNTKVSIIIPARNEEQNIQNCLNAIVAQDYSSDLVEIIVVDDFSIDSTADIVSNYTKKDIKLIRLSDSANSKDIKNAYKKRAIELAVNEAAGTLILTTDADCTMSNKWLSSLVSFYETNNYRLISGPVTYHYKQSFFEIFQTLDFLGLIVIGGGAIGNNSPVMCNGANLAYEKDTFLKVNGYKDVDNIASGDDVFLMQKISVLYPGEVGFIKCRDSIVTTNPVKTFNGFYNQRKRWVSKSTKYTNKLITIVLIFVYCFNLSILLNIGLSFFNTRCFQVMWLQISLKFFVDAIFMIASCYFFKQKKILWLFLPVQVMHLIYIVVIGLTGFMGNYKWKGRTVK